LTTSWPHQEQQTHLKNHASDLKSTCSPCAQCLDLKDNGTALRTRALTLRPHCRLEDHAPDLKMMCSSCAQCLGLKDNGAASRTRALALRLRRHLGDHAFNIKTTCLPSTQRIHFKNESLNLKSTSLMSAVPPQQQHPWLGVDDNDFKATSPTSRQFGYPDGSSTASATTFPA
jgi:hypothetical protein